MTTTHPDLTTLLAAVREFPDDDTPRLVLADKLDDLAGTAPCPEKQYHGRHRKCLGCDSVFVHIHSRSGCDNCEGEPSTLTSCPTCHGTGTVSDGYAERAEFIRVQVELARREGTEQEREECSWGASCVCRSHELRRRERTLLDDERRREWSGIKCPVCEGTGDVDTDNGPLHCSDCDGTGFAPVEFRRGFVDRVRCRMGDVLWEVPLASDFVGVEHTPMTWQLTPWAAGVLAAHPVTRWEIVDREPWQSTGHGKWVWFRGQQNEAWLPGQVFDAFVGKRIPSKRPPTDGMHREFDTEAEARDALALAVGRVARRLAGLREVPT